MENEKRLYEAAIEGNVSTLKALIQEDPLTLGRISLTFFNETPLHIVILRGHLEFARVVLSHKPQLATESDSLGNSPLHLASTKGYVEMVRELLRVCPGACLVHNEDGKLPLHLAVMKGDRVEVVRELTRVSHESTRLRLDRGETIYHLCVKYDNLEALKMLMEELVDESDGSRNLVNARDDDGNSILHLASLHKNLQIIGYLLTRPNIELNSLNNNSLTPLDMVKNSPRDLKTLEVLNFLMQSNYTQRAGEHSSMTTKKSFKSISDGEKARPRSGSKTKSRKRFFTFDTTTTTTQLEEIRGELFVTAAIIFAIIFLPLIYIEVHTSNSYDLVGDFSMTTISLWSALIVMIILLTGVPLSNGLCAWFVVQFMHTAIGFLGLYFISRMTTNEDHYVNVNTPLVLRIIWFALLMLVSLLNLVRIIAWLIKSIKGCAKRRKLRVGRENVLSNA